MEGVRHIRDPVRPFMYLKVLRDTEQKEQQETEQCTLMSGGETSVKIFK